MVRVLELFSGTGSISKVCLERKWDVVTLDRDMKSDIQEDIMTWDYKKNYKPGDFDIITASPVCLYWSKCRNSWIGRKIKMHGDTIITKEILQEDIDRYGKPMVDKVREILDYFKPKYFWIENPQTGSMKTYITDLPFYDVDYCKYSDFGYQKRTRFWTNIEGFVPKKCKKDCGYTSEKGSHKINLGGNRRYRHKETGEIYVPSTKKQRQEIDKSLYHPIERCTTTKHDRYRIPFKLIRELFDCCNFK